MNLEKPIFVSEIEQKIRPTIKVISLSGKGDPGLEFDEKIKRISSWLSTKGIISSGPNLGIYYLSRNKVGIENVVWEACVPVNSNVKTEGDFKYQELTENEVISIILTGNYSLIGQALNWMETEAKKKGIKTKWPLTEIYLKEGSEPITELQYFIDKQDIFK